MNKDFHYEGTYAAAVIAGFRPEAAAKIAWAAQTVDECTKEGIDLYYPELNKWAPIYTCQTVMEMVHEEVSVLSDETSDTLKNIRKVWMPFHFLPGNIAGLTLHDGGTPLQRERDQRDFLCMCQPDSPMVELMVQRAVSIFHHPDTLERQNLLIMVGIVMHVLADTWAHKYFTGTPNPWVNEVDSFTARSPLPDGYDDQTTPVVFGKYSIGYLGHGRIGHNPDYGCLTYQYHPSWKPAGQLLTKSGPDDFCEAFVQMEWALRCIRTGTPFTFHEFPIPNMPWLTQVRAIVSVPKADQTEAWRTPLPSFPDYTSLPPYQFSGKPHEMCYFQAYAKEHRAHVMGTLESSMNILNIH